MMGGLKFFPNLPKLHSTLLFRLQTVVLALTAVTADESTASKSKRNKLPEKDSIAFNDTNTFEPYKGLIKSTSNINKVCTKAYQKELERKKYCIIQNLKTYTAAYILTNYVVRVVPSL